MNLLLGIAVALHKFGNEVLDPVLVRVRWATIVGERLDGCDVDVLQFLLEEILLIEYQNDFRGHEPPGVADFIKQLNIFDLRPSMGGSGAAWMWQAQVADDIPFGLYSRLHIASDRIA